MPTPELSRGLVRLMAVVIAVTIANLYYSQPLLDAIAGSFAVSAATAGLVVTATQVGYAVGLFFVVPVGDMVRRKPVLVGLLCADAVVLAASAAAPGLRVFCGLALLVGLTSVVVQMLVPYAATLAADDRRAGVIGTLLSGLLVGILGARVFAGVLAAGLGWRAVYLVAAGLMVAAAAALQRWLPDSPRELSIRYRDQLWGVIHIARSEPVLRWRAAIGACAFAAFGCFWTTVTFLLAGHYHMSQLEIGLFGMLGVAGALAAATSGRVLNSRPHLRWATTAVIAAVLVVSFAAIYLGGTSLVWLVVGVLVMDAAMQALNVVNQAVVYDLLAEARSRITTVYVASLFAGAAIGSALGAVIYEHFAWVGAAATAAAFAAAGLIGVLASRRHERPTSQVAAGAPADSPKTEPHQGQAQSDQPRGDRSHPVPSTPRTLDRG